MIRLDRQRLEDFNRSIMPYILRSLRSRLKSDVGTRQELGARVCLSVIEELQHDMAKREQITTKDLIKCKIKDYAAIILFDQLMTLPLDPANIWQINSINDIIAQIHQSIIDPRFQPVYS